MVSLRTLRAHGRQGPRLDRLKGPIQSSGRPLRVAKGAVRACSRGRTERRAPGPVFGNHSIRGGANKVGCPSDVFLGPLRSHFPDTVFGSWSFGGDVRMSDAMRRGLRGTMQLSVAEIMLQVVEAFGKGGHALTLQTDQHVALLGLLTLGVTFAQNALEDRSVVRPVLKHPRAATGTTVAPTPGDGLE